MLRVPAHLDVSGLLRVIRAQVRLLGPLLGRALLRLGEVQLLHHTQLLPAALSPAAGASAGTAAIVLLLVLVVILFLLHIDVVLLLLVVPLAWSSSRPRLLVRLRVVHHYIRQAPHGAVRLGRRDEACQSTSSRQRGPSQ